MVRHLANSSCVPVATPVYGELWAWAHSIAITAELLCAQRLLFSSLCCGFSGLASPCTVNSVLVAAVTRVTIETDVFGMPVSVWHGLDIEAFPARIGRDLGVPCPHSYDIRHLQVRYRGLILPGTDSGILLTYYGVPEWYERNDSRIIDAIKAKNPNLPQEFRDRVWLNPDYDYFMQLVETLKKQ